MIIRPNSQSDHFLLAIIDALPLAMFCKDYKDGNGIFVGWNKKAEQLWGLKREDVLGKTDHDFFPKEQADYFQTNDLNVLRQGDLLYTDQEAVDSPKVGRRIVKTWKVPLADMDGSSRYLLGISLDRTEELALIEQLDSERRKSLMSAKLASLGGIASGIAHEINNPLAIIQGFALRSLEQIAINQYDIKGLEQSFQKIIELVDRISKIIVGLRSFAREGSKDPPKETAIARPIEEALNLCRSSIRASNIDLQYSPKLNIQETMIECVQIQITQVLVNLLNNARFAAELQNEKWIKIDVQEMDHHFDITVADSGNGIRQSDQDKIFDPFFTTKEPGQGTGLGLSICKGIIDNHKGEIFLDKKQKNTTFVVRLPKKFKDIKKAG